MRSNGKKVKAGDRSIRLDIPEQQPKGSSDLTAYWGSTLFEPGSEFNEPTPTGSKSDPAGDPAPEKRITLFALRLAVLEKAASGLGTLGFVWATVVLLGGFAVSLETIDFWFVTTILLVEGTRIYSRSHELEWQHQATKTLVGRRSFRALISTSRSLFRFVKLVIRPHPVAQSESSNNNRRLSDNNRRLSDDNQATHQVSKAPTRRTWHSPDVPLVPYAGWVFLSRNISRVLFWLQLVSATACVVLSLMRLIKQDYGEVKEDTKNRKAALDIFYALALAEAMMLLLEKAYWEWKVSYCKLLERVCHECELGVAGIVPIKRFFYDAYSSCINGSIFDGLKMDLVSFATELLASYSTDEQLIGARILQKFVMSRRFANDTLRKIGTSTSTIERLIEMLNWKDPSEEGIRRSAAEIVSKLAGKKQNALRVAGITGSMESVSSLLYTSRSSNVKPHEIRPRAVVTDEIDYEFSVFNLLGLLILKKLARDHDNCGKIGNARGLLAKIVDFTHTSENLLRNNLAPESQIKAVRRSLQLVKMLVSTTGHTGKALRRDISDIVFTVSNVREILQYGESHMVLQKLGIEILTSLAMDEDAREKIGNTGGVIKLLLLIFFKPGLTDEETSVGIEAGEALALLALESKRNCTRILKDGEVVERLVGALKEPLLRVNSSRILRNMCAYAGTECFDRLRGVTAAVPTVFNAIMVEKEKLLEVSVGLAAQIFRFTSPKEYAAELTRAGIEDTYIAEKLVQILNQHKYTEIKVPRIRLFVIALVIQMIRSQEKYILLFKNLGMEEVLECVAETTSELESFNVFSGSVGLSRHKTTLSALVDTALELMTKG